MARDAEQAAGFADSRWRTLYDWLLHLYPRGFQEQLADDMTRTFAHRLAESRRDQGPAGRARFLAGELGSLLFGAIGVRLRPSSSQGLPPAGGARRRPISILARELRHAVRRLVRSPGFTAASIITLGLGVGATTAVYSLVHSTVLSPLPYDESDRLVWLDHVAPGIGSTEGGLGMTDGLYALYRERVPALEDMAIWEYVEVTLSSDDPERVSSVAVTPSFFAALRERPAMGQAFTEADVRSGLEGAVISHDLWQRRFGGERAAVGRTIRANGRSVQVLGVMPAGFAFPNDEIDLWLPLDVDVATTDFGGFSREGIARLAPGATRASAEAQVRAAIPSLAERYGQIQRMLDDTQLAPRFPSLRESVVQDAQRTLWILLGSVVFVLLLACANVANLLIVRAESRHQEAAVRRALGAGRADMIRYFLSESFLLSLGGGLLGVGLASLAVEVLVRLGPEHLPRLSELTVSLPALLVTAAILLVTTLAFGLGPALRRGPSLSATVKAGGRGAPGSPKASRGRNALVAAQVGLALVLLVATGLMGRSFLHLVSIDPGFNAEQTLTFRVGLAPARYTDRAAVAAFHREALARMNELPGVEVAGATTCLPLCGSWAGTQLAVEGRPDDPDQVAGVVAVRRVHENYFDAMQISLVSGRMVTALDEASGNGAALISRELAATYWPGEDPIGARFGSDAGGDSWYTVVGIVENTPINALSDDPRPMVYLPLLYQNERDASPYELAYVLRTSVRPQTLIGPAREVIRSLDAEVPLARVATMESLVSEANVSTAFTTVVLGLAAVIALVLGLVGIYGVISYMVGRRAKEIGIRIALGARSSQVSGLVLAQGGKVTAVGLVVGILAALGLTRVMQNLLFGVSPTDPLTFAAVTVLLCVAGLAATYIPARRAARSDPVHTLRAD